MYFFFFYFLFLSFILSFLILKRVKLCICQRDRIKSLNMFAYALNEQRAGCAAKRVLWNKAHTIFVPIANSTVCLLLQRYCNMFIAIQGILANLTFMIIHIKKHSNYISAVRFLFSVLVTKPD